MPAARRPVRFALALTAIVGLVLAIGVSAAGPAGASATGPEVIATLSTAEVTLGAPLAVGGQVLDGGAPLANAPLALEAAPYPYRAFTTVARTVSGAGGSYSLDATLSLDVRLRVRLEGASPPVASALLQATVDPSVALAAADLGPGRTRLSVRLGHSPQLSSRPVPAWWFVAARGSRSFRLIDTTSTRELASGVTYASAAIDPPAARFVYRVCVNPTWERAMGAAAAMHGRCPTHDFTAPNVQSAASPAYQREGSGTPLPAYPPPGAIASAVSYLDGRAGRTSLAVLDSSGRISGTRLDEHFQSASVVKVMFLTAFLQRLAADHRGLSASDESLLYPMIHESNNDDASAVLDRVGAGAVARVAREAGMRDYVPAIGWWAYTQTSAADQARFFIAIERLIPDRFWAYARRLMAGIEAEQSWGIPEVARPAWQVFFKTGALPSEGLFNETARLERAGTTFTVSVFSTGDPSQAYGEETMRGVAEHLLAGAPPGA